MNYKQFPRDLFGSGKIPEFSERSGALGEKNDAVRNGSDNVFKPSYWIKIWLVMGEEIFLCIFRSEEAQIRNLFFRELQKSGPHLSEVR